MQTTFKVGDAVAFAYNNGNYDCGELIEISNRMVRVKTYRSLMYLPYDSLEPYIPSKKMLMVKLGDWLEFQSGSKTIEGQIVAIHTDRFPRSFDIYCPANGSTYKKIKLSVCSKAWIDGTEIILK